MRNPSKRQNNCSQMDLQAFIRQVKSWLPKKSILGIIALFVYLSSSSLVGQIKFSGYAEVYYNHDFSLGNSAIRDDWFYNHHLHNTIAPNAFILESRYHNRGVYAQLDLMFGSYSGRIMANEPLWATPIYQAYVGWKVYKNTFVEAGIFESGIGLESAKGAENPTLTRSIYAENTPYFLSGIRARWNDPTDVFMVEVALVNGWETITRQAAESAPGVMGRWRLGSNKVQVHYNFLYTSDAPGLVYPRNRMLNGFYFKHALNKWQWFLGYDAIRTDGANVHMPYLILRREINEKWAVALRGEYARDFSDSGFLRPYEGPQVSNIFEFRRDLRVYGSSLNVDFSPRENLLIRAEFRVLDGDIERNLVNASNVPIQISPVIRDNYSNYSLTLAAAISF